MQPTTNANGGQGHREFLSVTASLREAPVATPNPAIVAGAPHTVLGGTVRSPNLQTCTVLWTRHCTRPSQSLALHDASFINGTFPDSRGQQASMGFPLRAEEALVALLPCCLRL